MDRENSKKTKPKKGRTNLECPVCGGRMVHQFHDLQHCKCGISWMPDMGFFERTPDMVFCLERRWVGKKSKQFAAIRFK